VQIYDGKREIADWIRRRLGAPILKAVPLAPEQLDDAIDYAVEYANQFMGGVGNQEDLAIVFTKPYDDCESLLPEEDERLIKNHDYVHNPTGMTVNVSGGRGGVLRYRQEYQLPRNVLAVSDVLNGGGSGFGALNAGASDDDQSILSVASLNSAFGGLGLGGIGGISGGTTSMATASGLFVPATAPGFGAFGTRGGFRAAGGGIDLISFTLGMQYLEMVHQMFTVKLRLQFLTQERKVRFSPAPPANGFVVFGVWTRVVPRWMYENQWVKDYALARAMKDIAFNGKLYDGAGFPGGVKLNFDFYNEEADKAITKLEKDILDNKWGEPPVGFLVG
jgi:hypothetical protein